MPTKVQTEFAKAIEAQMKRELRAHKKRFAQANKLKALPKIVLVKINANYINPITLNKVPSGPTVYEITNRTTGRKNYYDKNTFWKLMKKNANNYALLVANPKSPIPGVRNPITRGAIYPRNVRRVTVKPKKKTPSKSAAARKIQAAVRSHLKKKKAAKK